MTWTLTFSETGLVLLLDCCARVSFFTRVQEVKVHNCACLEGRWGMEFLRRYFLGVLFVDIVQCSDDRLLVGKPGGM